MGRKLDARARRIVDASNSLLPLVKAANQLLRRKRLAADELARAVPGLDGWPARYGLSHRGVDLAIYIATGESAFEIVARVFGTRRTPEQIRALCDHWRKSQLRAAG